MPSAVLFFPCHIIELTNFVTRSDPYTGSGSTVRFAICPLRGIQTPGFKVSEFQCFKVVTWIGWNFETFETLKLAFIPFSAASLHTSSVLAYGSRRPRRRAFRESRDTELPAGLSHVHRGSAQSSAPADYGQRQGYRL